MYPILYTFHINICFLQNNGNTYGRKFKYMHSQKTCFIADFKTDSFLKRINVNKTIKFIKNNSFICCDLKYM